jgi:hypothetical protein
MRQSDSELAMPKSTKWIVCEESGRWTAAIRTAFVRLQAQTRSPRLYEVRSLAEASAYLDESTHSLILVEVIATNLVGSLVLLRRCEAHLVPFVALLGETSRRPHLADLLWEAGATEVVESPRELRGLIALHQRISSAAGFAAANLLDRESFADWAWSTLPWQDT